MNGLSMGSERKVSWAAPGGVLRVDSVASASANSEAHNPCGPCGRCRLLEPGLREPHGELQEQSPQPVGFPFQHQIHAPVIGILGPPRDAESRGFAAGGPAETHALDVAFGADLPADGGRGLAHRWGVTARTMRTESSVS